ncbi:MAG: DUF5615 family PIN-like protein [Xanthobacteraceae bacterium]|nr:DUF5615 family PIN-like protein [Xanthobacteraceae bacterium]
MRILADENVPAGVVEELIAASHDVQWAVQLSPDPQRAAMDNRILPTFDK